MENPKNQMNNIGSDINNSKYIPLTPQGPYFGPSTTLYDGIKPITQTQSQVSQLEIKYAGPLVKNSIVKELNDLTKLPVSLNYQHRRVWVKEYGCEYYLDNGDGTRLENWKRAIGRLVVHIWSELENYQEGDVVSYFGKLYFAKQNITIPTTEKLDVDGNIIYNENGLPELVYNPNPLNTPLNNEDLWQVITGEIETYSWHFPNTNQIQIYTEIRNPRFEICLGELILDENNEIKYNSETGLPIYKNIEIVEAYICQGVLNKETGEITQDIYDDEKGNITADSEWFEGGVPYVIQLFTDEIIDKPDKDGNITYYDTERIEKLGLSKTIRTKFNVIVNIK